MIRLPVLRTVGAVLLLAALLGTAALGQHFRLYERAWFAVKEWRMAADWQTRSLWLPDYYVVVEGRPIAGIENVSALTYDPDRKTLFTVTNQDTELIELSLDGAILRRIALAGFGDTEAVEYISRGVYVISDERRQRLFKVRVDDDTRQLDAAASKHLSIGIGRDGNLGFEGLAWDADGRRLFVAKEKPVRIYEIRGFPEMEPGQSFAVDVADDPKRDRGLFVRDISSLQYDRRTGHLLALSDESRLVVELDTEGRPISTLPLSRGSHGLNESVPQAEGVAMDDEGTLYLVSEPNLFYVFRKSRR
ncbi:MAG TPA: SdiA-regulated domain-containing protein [Azospira sp.]|nr:SdiA-regulated domain-containing protein [Azospira sp.]